jgi:hypothetical protein
MTRRPMRDRGRGPIAVLTVAIVLAACTSGGPPPDPTTVAASAPTTETPAPSPTSPMPPPAPATAPSPAPLDLASPRPVPDHPDPVVRAGAAGRFVRCDGPVHTGGWTVDFGGTSGSRTPQAALDAFVAGGSFSSLPRDGYRMVGIDAARALFTYEVEGRARVAVVVADSRAGIELEGGADGWGIEVFAACDPSEFGAEERADLFITVWTDADGAAVATDVITSYRGAEHCDWESVTFLSFQDRQYVRDPAGRLTDGVVAPFELDADLPADAEDTGLRSGVAELWTSPSDDRRVFVVTPDRTEVWPATARLVACR